MTVTETTKAWFEFIWNEILFLLMYTFFFSTEYGLALLVQRVLGDEAVHVPAIAVFYQGVKISLTLVLLLAWFIHGVLTFGKLLLRHWNSFVGEKG